MEVKIINLAQDTSEWLQWRKDHITATDAATILGKNPWERPLDLWRRKRGELPPVAENPAMKRGKQLEPVARQAWIEKSGLFAAPAVVEHPDLSWMGASLDGLAVDASYILEIKCPGESTHEQIKSGEVPEHYYAQVQHQLCCVPPAQKVYFVSYRPEDENEPLAVIEVLRDDAFISEMAAKEKSFWDSLQKGEPPISIEWESLEHELFQLEKQKKDLEERIKDVRQRMIDTIPDGQDTYEGFLYLATLVSRQGSVDTKKAFTKAVNLIGQEEFQKLTGKTPDEFLEGFRKPNPKPSWTFRQRKVDEETKSTRKKAVKTSLESTQEPSKVIGF